MAGLSEKLEIIIGGDARGAVAAIGNTSKSLFQLKEDTLKFQGLVWTEKDVNKIKKYNAEIQRLEKQVEQTSNVGKVGFDKMGNAIKGSQGPLNAMYGSIRQIAYILPGLGIAGIFGLAFSAIGSAAKEMGIFGEKTGDAAEAAKKLNEELLSSRTNGEQEVIQLKALADVAANTALSHHKRMIAVKELRDQYPAYFKDLTDEQILTGNITKATDELTSAIYARAEARAREADIAKKATKVFENEQKVIDLNKKIDKVREKKGKGEVVVGGGTLGGISGTQDIGFQLTLIDENKLLKERDAILSESSSLQLDIALGQKRINELKAGSITLDETQERQAKKKLTDAEKYAKFLAIFKAHMLGAQQKSLYAPPVKKTDEKEKPIPLPPPMDFKINPYKKIFADIDKQNAKDAADAIRTATGAAMAAGQAFERMWAAMEAGKGIGEVIADMFKEMAKQIIGAAIKAAIFNVVLSAVTGGTSVPFKDLFGSFLGIGGGKNPGAANGAIVTGPSLVTVGEGGESEAILPLSRLNSMLGNAASMGGGGGGMVQGGGGGEFVLRGSDMVLLLQRAGFNLNVRR